jgi:hypothetical protein
MPNGPLHRGMDFQGVLWESVFSNGMSLYFLLPITVSQSRGPLLSEYPYCVLVISKRRWGSKELSVGSSNAIGPAGVSYHIRERSQLQYRWAISFAAGNSCHWRHPINPPPTCVGRVQTKSLLSLRGQKTGRRRLNTCTRCLLRTCSSLLSLQSQD